MKFEYSSPFSENDMTISETNFLILALPLHIPIFRDTDSKSLPLDSDSSIGMECIMAVQSGNRFGVLRTYFSHSSVLPFFTKVLLFSIRSSVVLNVSIPPG